MCAEVNPHSETVRMRNCEDKGYKSLIWTESDQGGHHYFLMIRNERSKLCLTCPSRPGEDLLVQECHHTLKEQKWTFHPIHI